MTEKYECTNCGATKMPSDDVVYCAWPQTQETPAEYQYQCPSCGAGDDCIQEMSAFWCRGCEDVQVQDEGNYCEECTGEMTEARSEAMQPHSFYDPEGF